MGAKATKAQTEQKTKKTLNLLRSTEGIDTQNEETFTTKSIRADLASVKEEFKPGQKLLIKRYTRSTPFMKWISNLDYEEPFFHELGSLCKSDRNGISWYKFISITLQSEADIFIVAFLPSGNIVGFSIVGEDFYEKNSLRRYVTCAGPRGYGIGYALVNEIHTIAKEGGKKYVRLAAATNSAIAYHKRQGYILTGKEVPQEGPEMLYTLPVNGGTRKKRLTRRRKLQT